jgi:hypothetical protein
MAVHEAQLVPEMLEHYFHRWIRLAAGRAFEVSVFNYRDPRRVRPEKVIAMVYRDCQRIGAARSLVHRLTHRYLLKTDKFCPSLI